MATKKATFKVICRVGPIGKESYLQDVEGHVRTFPTWEAADQECARLMAQRDRGDLSHISFVPTRPRGYQA